MNVKLYLLLIVVGRVCCVNTDNHNVVTVNTTVGEIAGKVESVTLPDGTGSTISIFKGIPYAEPPLGDLRFAKPVAKENFTLRFDAFAYGPSCPSDPNFSIGGGVSSEDCLYLNVFVPSGSLPTSQNDEDRSPVLVWIHGGAFVAGFGYRQVGTLVVFSDIIVVTLNYRLGALGFLSTDDQQAPGNFGLWDQRLALLWVKNNIAAFGGDPDNISIGGGSAGAFGATYHAMYPENEGLFRRIIAASGTSISVIGARRNVGTYARLLAKKLDCGTFSSHEIIGCLRTKNASDIAAAPIYGVSPFDLAWTPTLDGTYVSQWPGEQIQWPPAQTNLSFLRSLDFMVGTTSAEGSVSVSIFVQVMAQRLNQTVTGGVSEQLFDTVVQQLLVSQGLSPEGPLLTAVKHEFRDWQETSASCSRADGTEGFCEDLRSWQETSNPAGTGQSSGNNQSPTDQQGSTANQDHTKSESFAASQYRTDPAALGQSVVVLLTDAQWFVPSVVFSRNHAVNNNRTNTYTFLYDEPKRVGFGDLPWARGAPHLVYESLIFGNFLPETPLNLSIPEQRKLWNLSKTIMTYVSNFVKTGNPNSPISVDEEWLPFDLRDERYLYISEEAISSRKRCKARRTAFWLDYLPVLKSAISGSGSNGEEGGKTCNTSEGNRLTVNALFLTTTTVLTYYLLGTLYM